MIYDAAFGAICTQLSTLNAVAVTKRNGTTDLFKRPRRKHRRHVCTVDLESCDVDGNPAIVVCTGDPSANCEACNLQVVRFS